MSDGVMVPKFVSKQELLDIIDEIRQRVEIDDSFEGFLNYLMPEEGDDPGGFRVEARWRVGNSMGQGGMRIVADTA